MSVQDKAIAFLMSPEGIEQAELTGPWEAVQQAGGRPVLLATAAGEVQAFNHLDPADTFPVDKPVAEGGLAFSRPLATAVLGAVILLLILLLPQRAGRHPE